MSSLAQRPLMTTSIEYATVLLVNNSRETFTPTMSGAISTCLWEILNVLESGEGARHVFTLRHPRAPAYSWPDLHFASGSVPLGDRGRVGRARRRLTAWSHPGQRVFAAEALRVARDVGARLVVCNNDPEIASFLAAALPEAHVVHWFHNLEVAADSVRRRLAATDRVDLVAVSAYLARAIEAVYRLGPARVRVVPNGVDTRRFGPSGPIQEHGETVPVVGFLGRIAVEKGVDTVLAASQLLADTGVPFKLLLVGDTNWGGNDGGPYGRLVADQVTLLRRRGVEVETTGHVQRADLPGVLNRMDVQVLASRWDEPFGLALLEGMAAGNAVIATATGGIPEVIGDAGILVPREDPVIMAQSLSKLLRDSQTRNELRFSARRRAESMSWKATWEGLSLPASMGRGSGIFERE